MSLIGRHAGLALAALLALVLALASYRGGTAASPPAPPAPVIAPPRPAVAPPRPAAPVAKARKKARKKLLAKLVPPPAAPVKVRGARLREKGEALGGGTPDRVDTGTMTVRAAQ
ncbi:MAG: hypothetical protein PHS14_01890 [Elusimicrobia bacterium]|nr:hypothetical protein [Elusimicrobiota bacterium]